MNQLFYLIPVFGVIALLYTAIKSSWVTKQDAGNERMKEISNYIAEGAMAFLKAEYKVLAYFVVIAAILLAVMGGADSGSHWSIAVAFVIGAFFSALAGFIGMKIATKANVRTAEAARTSLSKALQVSFTGGSVMGMGVAGLAVLGLGSLFIILYMVFVSNLEAGSAEYTEGLKRAIEVLTGFSLGAESIALFARVGGGIYTKAADVGADLVGKVEAGIPEDDPRNPATIADNVGDNVGDVAGMGADLFGSYVATVLATMVLGRETISVDNFGGLAPILLPMLIAGTGIIFSIVGTLFVRVSDEGSATTNKVQKALNMGNWGSIVITALASYFLVKYLLPETMTLRGHEFTSNGVFGAIMVGLVVGTLMSIITEYYTAMGKRPVLSIIRQSATGAATNIIGGLSVGMESTALPIIVLAGGIFGSYLCAGLYGVAIAAAGMMATTAMQLAIDAFGPIADNAGGIAEMSELPKEVREKTDILDAVGNTTAATGKGFAIASAALTALALFAAFVGIAGIDGIDIYKADVLAGLFVGGMIPFLFSSFAIAAVGRAAMSMVEEVRRQFREIPGIMEGKAKPEYDKCVAISTQASLREMMIPGAIAIIAPLLIGFIFGPEVLGGFLAGATVSGVLIGMFQNNAGGAWDNAKKSFEKGVDINGEMFYKKSGPHTASVTGDTVGDPFKDTSGPSMNILIKLMSIVALVIAPTISKIHAVKIAHDREMKAMSLMAAMHPGMDMMCTGEEGECEGKSECGDKATCEGEKSSCCKTSDCAEMKADCEAMGCKYEDCKAMMNMSEADMKAKCAEMKCDYNKCKSIIEKCKTNCSKEATTATLDANGNYIYNTGNVIDVKLADGTILKVGENSVENKLIAFINDASKKVDKTTWFSLDRLYFETGKSTLTAASAEQVKNIAAILKANPKVKLKLGGYTDNVGDSKSNLTLSGERAKTALAELAKLGINSSRLSAEGYGIDHPIADNATAEGRAQNRRIDVRVTEK